MLRSTVLLFLLWCARAKAVDFEDCGSADTPVSINIGGCSKAPCDLLAGSNINVTSTSIAGSDSNMLYPNVYLRLNLINFDVTVTPSPCASGSNTVCPVRAGDVIRYTAVVTIDEDLPPVAGYLYWRLYNEKGNTVVCFKVEVRIVYGIRALKVVHP